MEALIDHTVLLLAAEEEQLASSRLAAVFMEDLLIEVLSRLSVKSLSRFKSVCKSWCTLIQRPDFIHHHVSTFDNSNLFGTFILQCTQEANLIEIPHFLSISGSSGGGSGSGHEHDTLKFPVFKDFGKVPYFQFDSESGRRVIHIVGSCNGIVCIHDVNRRDVALWNPATKQFRLLPKPSTYPEYNKEVHYGEYDCITFGFDIESKDYKVVKITGWGIPLRLVHSFIPEVNSFRRVQVYSVSNDSWRCIDNDDVDLPSCYHFHNVCLMKGQYLDGNYFLSGQNFYGTIEEFVWEILSFDLIRYKFRTIQPPSGCDLSPRGWYDNSLSLVGEKLALIERKSHNDAIHVWILNDHGYKKEESSSWTKLYTVCIPRIRKMDFHHELLAITKNGQIGLFMGKILKFYNFVTHELMMKECNITNTEMHMWKAFSYKPSLVSIKRG